MCRIAIRYEDREFEHDIYDLVKAFYPTAQVHSQEGTKEDWDVLLVAKAGGEFLLRFPKGAAASSTIAPLSEGRALIRRERKIQVKKNLYHLLSRHTKKELPWGNLTGIRPVKLTTDMLENGMDAAQAAQRLREIYDVSSEKISLALEIARREMTLLENLDYAKGYSLYIGIPFCPSICLYCSFSSSPISRWKEQVGDYLQALKKEMAAVSAMMEGMPLHTVYIGGGTPTTLSPEQLTELLGALKEYFPCDGLFEFTVEAGRPDSITREKLQALRQFPVSRISVNPQTMHQRTLDLIGRRHTVEDTKNAFSMARREGFSNINMDLIVGLPGENKEMVRQTLGAIKDLAPDSLTVHSLAVKRAARLNLFKEQYREMGMENSQEIMDMVMDDAREMDMQPYYLYRQKNMAGNFENVGYAREHKAGLYNILMMEERQPIVALGAGGASKLVCGDGRVERVENVKDVKSYIARIDEMISRKRKGVAACLSKGGRQGDGA